MKKRQKQNRYLMIYLSLILFCLFFISNDLFAKTFEVASQNMQNSKIQQEKGVVDDSYFYDFDYDDLDYGVNNNKTSVDVWDPWEKMNRKTFAFNMFFLDYVVHPLYYKFYVKITTFEIRKSVYNINKNFEMPTTFVNYVLQLDFKNSAKSLYSFIINTTFGVFGIFDIAGIQEVSPPNTDLGITLSKYKIPAGPYIVLPFLGANDVRGTLTWGGEFMADSFGYNIFKIGGKREIFDDWVYWTRGTVFVLDNSTYVIENFYDLMKTSFDPYIMLRDAYGQSQAYKIKKVRGEE